jgi:ABC-type branched-subunit amino acid transport system substrate-binding protein
VQRALARSDARIRGNLYFKRYVCVLSLIAVAGCQVVLGLDDYRAEESEPLDTCTDATPCEEDAPRLSSEHCPLVYGAATDPQSIRLGALLDLTGTEARTALMQARASGLAVAQLNAAGGIRLPEEEASRPLALIVCDGQIDAAELRDVLDQLSVKALLGPSAAALEEPGSDLLRLAPIAPGDASSGFSWGMTVSEADRAPLLSAQLQAIAAQRVTTKVAYVMSRSSANSSVRLTLAQRPDISSAREVSVYEYESAAEILELAFRLAAQEPDVVVADGASTAVDLIDLLERALPSEAARPHYLLTEAAQVPRLLALAAANRSLHERLTVVGAAPTEAAAGVYARFEAAYRGRYRSDPAAVTGVAASYSAVYALAYAAMSASAPLQDAADVASGLHALDKQGTPLSTAADSIVGAVYALGAMQPVSVMGTLGELRWDEQGSPLGARVGVYCVGQADRAVDEWSFLNTGYGYDVDRAELIGQPVLCAPTPETAVPATPAAEPSTSRESAVPTTCDAPDGCGAPPAADSCSTDAAACGVEECDMSGVYALELRVPVTWPASTLLMAGSGEFVSWARVQLSQSGTDLSSGVVPCGQTVPDFQNAILITEAYGVEYPETIFDHAPLLPAVPALGTLGGTAPGAAFSLGRTAWLAGLELSDPIDGAWPSVATVVQRDDDADGAPGITGVYKSLGQYAALPVDSAAIARADRGHIAARIVFNLDGTLTSCARAEGAATAQAVDSHTLGCQLSLSGLDCSLLQAAHLDTNTPSYVTGPAAFVLQKVADDAGCSEVRAALPGTSTPQ